MADQRRTDRWPYVLVLPAVLLELGVHLVPLVAGALLSVHHVTPAELRRWRSAPYVGLENYREWLSTDGALNHELVDSLLRTAVYTVVVVAAAWALGMVAALAVAPLRRGRAFWETFLLVPFALPGFVSVLAWRYLLDRDTGAVNTLLVDDLGLLDHRPFWLVGGNSFWAVVAVSVWRLWPFAFVVLAASLRSVPRELYEAAALDGASPWQRLRRITLPATRRSSLVLLLLISLWTCTDFSTPYLLFDATPPPQATLLGNLVYERAFVAYDLGSAAAVNIVVVAFLLVAGACAWPLVRRWSDG